MRVELLFFGQVADITGVPGAVIEYEGDTDQLRAHLESLYAGLSGARYILALDQKVVLVCQQVDRNCTIALLPPFSGG